MKLFLQKLKIILQSKYEIFLIVFAIVGISLFRTNIKSEESVYEKEDVLEVISIKYGEKDQVIFKGKNKFIAYYQNFPYLLGDIIKVQGTLVEISNNTIPNIFNYRDYLEKKEIIYEIKIQHMNLIRENRNLLFSIKNKINQKLKNVSQREYIYAFLLGDSSYFSDEQIDMYRKCGLMHLLTIGSFEIMIITKILTKIKERIRLKEKGYWFLLFVVYLLYIIFTCGKIGVIRSSCCYLLNRILKYYHIKFKYSNLILLIGCLLLIINPYYLYHISFQYSFIISYIISKERKKIKGSFLKKTLCFALVSFIASFPITLYYNYQVNFLSIFLSSFFIYIVNYLIIPLSLVTFIFVDLENVFQVIISFFESVLLFFSKIDFFNIVYAKPSFFLIIIYYLCILFLPKRKIIFFSFFCFIYKILILLFLKISFNYVMFVDVSQGDAIIIKTSDNITLIDTGGSIYNSYTKKIIQYLHSIGVSEIDNLILSHGDFDHMGEAINLVNNFKVDKVIFNCGPYNDLEQELIKVLDKKKIKYYSCIKELNINNNKLFFLQTKEYDNENDNSNVIYTELNGYKFMFMGDASVTTEEEILDKYNLPDIDVLKVGHHGSRTSSGIEFIDEINPKYSIISVGKNNRYGHPNKEVLENLNDSKIYRTDQNGSITFKIRNNKLQIETCNP